MTDIQISIPASQAGLIARALMAAALNERRDGWHNPAISLYRAAATVFFAARDDDNVEFCTEQADEIARESVG